MANALVNMARLLAAVTPAVEQALDETMQRAAALAATTTAFHNRTGRLRGGIRGGILHRAGASVTGAVTTGRDDADPGRGADWAAASNEYAPAIELGTGRSAPRPFLHPAFVRVVHDGSLGDAIRQGLREAVR